MPKLTETFVRKISETKSGTDKRWGSELKGLVLFVGKRATTWYYPRDLGGHTRRALIGRYPVISAEFARQTALGFALELGRDAGESIQMGPPTLEVAMAAYLGRPKLRSEAHKLTVRGQFALHLKDWFRLALNEITKAMVVERHQSMARTPSAANWSSPGFVDGYGLRDSSPLEAVWSSPGLMDTFSLIKESVFHAENEEPVPCGI